MITIIIVDILTLLNGEVRQKDELNARNGCIHDFISRRMAVLGSGHAAAPFAIPKALMSSRKRS